MRKSFEVNPTLAALAATLCFSVVARADFSIHALNDWISVVTDAAGQATAQSDGKLLLGGSEQSADGSWAASLQRFGTAGDVDPTFDGSALGAREIDLIIPLQTGETLIAGRFGADPNADDDDESSDARVPDPEAIVRLTTNGARDRSFETATLPFYWIVAVNPLPDGSALVSGYVAGQNPDGSITNGFQVVKVSPSGALDPQFHTDLPADLIVDLVQALPGGRTLLITEESEGDSGDSLTCLNPDGSIDVTFRSGLAAGSDIDALTALPNGQLLVASEAEDDSLDEDTLTRLNSDGSVDSSFVVTLPGIANRLLVTKSGLVLAVGDFTDAASQSHSQIERVDSSGKIVPLLDPVSTDNLQDVALLPGGGFAMALSAPMATDGTYSGAVETFDDAGALLSRTAVSNYLESLVIRPDGGLYALTSSLTGIFEPPLGATLVDGGFSPPPATGVSIIKSEPTVTIKAARAAGYAGGLKKAKFLLTRDGPVTQALKVTYTVKGTALGGRDYQALSGVKYFKPGRSTAKIKVRPMGSRYERVRPGGASVKLTLNKRRAYLVGATSSAKVWLLNHRGPKSRP